MSCYPDTHTLYQALGVSGMLWSRVCKCWTLTVCVPLSGEGHDWQRAAGLCLWTVPGQDSGRDKKCHSADTGRSPALYSGWVTLDTCVYLQWSALLSSLLRVQTACTVSGRSKFLPDKQNESFNKSLGHYVVVVSKLPLSLCPRSAFRQLMHPS